MEGLRQYMGIEDDEEWEEQLDIIRSGRWVGGEWKIYDEDHIKFESDEPVIHYYKVKE